MSASTLSYQLFIGGEWADSSGDEALDVVNPSTEEVIGTVPQATPADVDRAVAAARDAFDEGAWPRMTPRERGAIMLKMGAAFARRREQIVDLNIREAGSTRMLAEFLQVGIPIEHFIDMADRVLPRFDFEAAMLPYVGQGIGQGVVVREPYGVAGLISAYNFPFFLNLFKLAPALAAGCTTVLKPSPLTPLEAFVIGEVAQEAGLPPGVLNIVTGDIPAGEALTRHPGVDLVSFTGSGAVGRKVYGQGADTLKKVVLELGGKSANVILDDASLDKVTGDVIGGMTIHCGQGCSLLTRTIVHESLHDELVSRLKAALDYLKVGDPADPTVMMGPLISERQRQKVEGLIRAGQAEGAQIAYGGGRPAGLDKGFFVEPTLFVNVANSMQIAQQEFFGPVGVIIPFSTDEEAVRLANASDFGLGGGVWSGDPVRAYGIARQLRTGTVTVNGGGGGLSPHAAFGGYKQSGLGREWGEHGLSEFLQTKSITWGVAAG
jgi:acyl-CoA reductase-like NAD-dependent aldehyde dehydrogenase